MNNWREAEGAYQKALALREQLVTEHPDPDHRHDLAVSHFSVAELFSEQAARANEAKAAYLRAQALLVKLTADWPDHPEYRLSRGVCSNNLAALLRKMNEPLGAEETHRDARETFEKLVNEFPEEPEYRIKLATSQVNYGNLRRRAAAPLDALGWYDKALAQLKPVERTEPAPADARRVVCAAHRGRVQALDALDRSADARSDWNRAVELSSPQDKPATRLGRALSRARAGAVKDAVAEADELAKISAPPAYLYDLARVYAVAADRDERNHEAHVQKGVRVLRSAIERGFKDVERLKTSADLKALRTHGDFRELLVELERPKN